MDTATEIKQLTKKAEARQLGIKAIERIEKMPARVERWRATRELVLAANPKLIPLDADFSRRVGLQREGSFTSTGAGKHGRQILSMPDFIYFGIISMDTELAQELNNKDRVIRDRAYANLAKAFPEYRTARKI